MRYKKKRGVKNDIMTSGMSNWKDRTSIYYMGKRASAAHFRLKLGSLILKNMRCFLDIYMWKYQVGSWK